MAIDINEKANFEVMFSKNVSVSEKFVRAFTLAKKNGRVGELAENRHVIYLAHEGIDGDMVILRDLRDEYKPQIAAAKERAKETAKADKADQKATGKAAKKA